jgi:hypothetical protein
MKLAYFLVKGSIMCKKLPYMVTKTKRGFHYAWCGLSISEEQSYHYRLKLGDDINRIKLDMSSPKRLKQILFDHKAVYVYDRDWMGNIIDKRRIQ